MTLKFWGVRGSYPVSEENKVQFGGRTCCVELRPADGSIIIFDAGTGIIPLGNKLLQEFGQQNLPPIHIFLSHTHWDHIIGFPFFRPAFLAQTQITIYGPRKPSMSLEETILTEFHPNYSPIRYDLLPAKIFFVELTEDRFRLNSDITIQSRRHLHPGGAYGYRAESKGKTFVFNTDVEHYPKKLDERVIELSEGADLMLHDAQYTHEELANKLGWGHSSIDQAIEVAKVSGVKNLGLFHHDPDRTDDDLINLESKGKQKFSDSFICRQDQVVVL